MHIVKNFVTKIKNGFCDLIYPKHLKCIFCDTELKDLNNYDCCEKCFYNLPFINENSCKRCGNPFVEGGNGVCKNCKANNFEFELARSIFEYNDKIKPVIYKLKYSNSKYLAEPLSYFIYTKLNELKWNIDIITSVPLHKNRQKFRGYNQSKELAQHLSKLTQVPYHDLATRIIDNPSQTSLNIKARKDNVKDIFKSIKHDIKDKTILIIDDTYTTGATVNELSTVLKRSHAKNVYVITLAHSILKENL